MAVGDSELFDVAIDGGTEAVVVPAVAGKRVRTWRMLLTFKSDSDDTFEFQWDAGGGDPSTFHVAHGDRMVLGYEVYSWSVGAVGAPVKLSVNGDVDIRGTVRAEYID